MLDTLGDEGIGCISFSPLDQGILTNKYIGAVPGDSRAAKHEWGDRLAQDKLSQGEQTQRHRARTRPEHGANGDCLEPAPSRNDIGAHRRQQTRTNRRRRRRAG